VGARGRAATRLDGGGRVITLGYFRRHQQTLRGADDIVLLDVAQEYVLEHLHREGLFAGTLVFKGGTALRKFVFGAEGRFSVDLDFGLVSDDPADADLVLDYLTDAALYDVRIGLVDRQGANARLDIDTPLGHVDRPARVSVRQQRPWLPTVLRPPEPFEHLDKGLAPEFTRAALPVLDLREMAAEKIAAFWRRRHARDLYDLEHLARVMQPVGVADDVCDLAALKIYADVVEEGIESRPLTDAASVFGCTPADVRGAEDLGTFRASETDVRRLLTNCRERYAPLATLADRSPEIAELAARCSRGDLRHVARARRTLVDRLAVTSL